MQGSKPYFSGSGSAGPSRVIRRPPFHVLALVRTVRLDIFIDFAQYLLFIRENYKIALFQGKDKNVVLLIKKTLFCWKFKSNISLLM